MQLGIKPLRASSVSLRVKIIAAICILVSLVSITLGVSTYIILSRNLFEELRSKVKALASLGSMTIDKDTLQRLAGRVRPDLPGDEITEIQSSDDFSAVSGQLNRIRDTEPNLVRFIYTFVPTEDSNLALFLVDGDVLLVGSRRPNGELIGEDGMSPFASPFDISDFPVARRAAAEKNILVETEYSYDADFGVNSVTGYAPITDDNGNLIAVLGLDMIDSDVRAVLSRTITLSVTIAGLALLMAVVSAVGMGTLFTRGIISLDKVMRNFGEQNLDIRAPVKSRDEVGRLGMSFNQMADVIQKSSNRMASLLAAYKRFVPGEFLLFLERESITEVRLGDQVLKEMTVLFSDIRSFTNISESMSPQEIFNFLNSYLSRIGPEVRNHGGFIDKYIGDAIMALFPEKPDDAVRAAIAMRSKLREYNLHRDSVGYPEIAVGIAVHTGSLMLGTIGEQERMDGTVIADAVNLCSRLEGLSRLYGDTILITGSTLSILEGRRKFQTRFIDRVRVRGRKETVLIYEVYDWEPLGRIELRNSLKTDWSEAMKLYYGRDFLSTFRLLRKMREKDPADRVVELYLRRCASLIRRGVPPGWEGVEVIDQK
jgi:class 3 adenylate cyclase/HAMP domain-containing protein